MKNRKKLMVLILSVVILFIITIGVTYAFFSYTMIGTKENTIQSGNIMFIYDEVDKNGNGIGIQDALPISDSEGKRQTNAFNFRIISTTNSLISIPYEITLRKKQGSDNIDDIVKVYLAKVTDETTQVANEEEIVTSIYDDLEDTTHNGYNEKILYSEMVPATNNEYNQGYRLKMWIDNSINYSPTIVPASCMIDNENKATEAAYSTKAKCEAQNGVWADKQVTYPYEGKNFTIMVNIYSNGKILREESKRADITSISINNSEVSKSSSGNYEVKLPEGTTNTTINVETENPYSTVTITKTQSDYETPIAVGNINRLSTSKSVSLSDGLNYFKVLVISEDKKVQKVEHIRIKVGDRLIGFANMIVEKATSDQSRIYSSPTLTTSSNNTSDAKGLYSLSVTNGYGGQSETGTTYYFRGNVNNNYVSFAGKVWRIIRVNEDGTIRLILNDNTDSNSHIFNSDYSKIYYSNSQVKNDVNTWYNQNIGNNPNNVNKVAVGNYFCEAQKSQNQNDYTCNNDSDGKGLLNGDYKVGLISYDEVVRAGGYFNSNNTSYYLNNGNLNMWTMSPYGFSGAVGCEWTAYNVVSYTDVSLVNVSTNKASIRPVINIYPDVIVTGNGTKDNPYTIYNSLSETLKFDDEIDISDSLPNKINITGIEYDITYKYNNQIISDLQTLGLGTKTINCIISKNGSVITTFDKEITIAEITDYYLYEGTETFTTTKSGLYRLEVWGAQGGNATCNSGGTAGGYGGYSVGTIRLNAGRTLFITVGGQGKTANGANAAGGYNGGGNATRGDGYGTNGECFGSGGGATHIATKTGLLSQLSSESDQSEILIVAGGGGGSGYYNHDGWRYFCYGTGGSGGGTNASDAYNYAQNQCGSSTIGGYGGKQSQDTRTSYALTAGTFGQGGSGTTNNGTAGGGGGYYGGYSASILGAGGGSGYINTSQLSNYQMYCYTGCSGANTTVVTAIGEHIANKANIGDGHAKITYLGE